MSIETFSANENQEAQVNRDLSPILLGLRDLVSRVAQEPQSHKPSIFLIGSLGRHISVSGMNNWSEYINVISNQPKFSPRRDFRGIWEIDVAVSDQTITWRNFADISGDISNQNRLIEIDPYFFKIDSKTKILKRGEKLTANPNPEFRIETYDFGLDDCIPKISVLDRWSQLLIYLSAGQLRKKDAPEIKMILESMIKNGDFSDKERVDEAKELIVNNKKLFSTRNILLFPYRLAMPQDLRERLYQMRKSWLRKNSDDKSLDQKPRHYQSTEPIYF